MKFEFETGYEGKQIVDPTKLDINSLVTDKDFITAYAELSKARHWGDSKINNHGKLAHASAIAIVDEVRIRLEKVGWHAHIFKTGSCECNCRREMYLHVFAGLPTVSEVPFTSHINLELTPEELFNEDGSLRTMQETLKLLRDRVGEDALNVDQMLKDNEISEETAEIVKAIMIAEDLDEIQEIDEDNRTFEAGEKTYTWRDNEEEAEREARECLEDSGNYMWKMAVEAGNTTLGLDDWIEQVLSMDGWQSELCRYDGCSYELENGIVYWRSN